MWAPCCLPLRCHPGGMELGTEAYRRCRRLTHLWASPPDSPALTAYTTILPLKMAIRWAGSLPMVTRTCTGSLLYFWSRMTAW